MIVENFEGEGTVGCVEGHQKSVKKSSTSISSVRKRHENPSAFPNEAPQRLL
jgi:hypothetical protein